jgi:hypothetical protein
MGLFGPPDVVKMEGKRDVDGLIKALGYQKDAAVRREAARALGRIGDQAAIEPLIITLREKDKYVALAAAEALGKIGNARAVEPIINARSYHGEEPIFAEALQKIGLPAVKPLTAALTHWSVSMCRWSAKVLDKLGWQPGKDETGAAYWRAKGDWAKVFEIGSPAVQTFIAELKDQSEYKTDLERCRTIEWLAKTRDARAVEPLIAELERKEDVVRYAAVQGLVWIGDTRAVEPLLTRLINEKQKVRGIIATTLVAWYKEERLSETQKKLVLAHQRDITMRHYDTDDCTGHGGHQDFGSVEFPL